MIAAELVGATKRFGPVAALDHASFQVADGEVVSLLGPNGAGKSTAIALLLGLRRPDSGFARLFGGDPRLARSRRLLGVTPQDSAFPSTLRVRELIELVRAHYDSPLALQTVLERFELVRLASRQLGGLSGGERRRVGVALAFAGGPRLVILDEPTTGLDREARLAVWDAVRAHAGRGGSILFTTHNLDEADTLAERIVLIEAGRIVAAAPVAALKASAGLTVVRFRADAGLVVDGAVRKGSFLTLVTRDGGAVVRRLVQDGVELAELEVRPLTLEEALETRERRA